ncbi:Smr/MutS family protein [Thiovibrio sp. JS02]
MTKKRPKTNRPGPVKSSAKKAKAPGIRKLTLDDDLGTIFANPSDQETRPGFASALARHDFSGPRLMEILSEKGEAGPPPLSPQARRKNAPPPQEELDLHGCTAVEAQVKTENFLARASGLGLRTVLIITGKGLHSPDGPVLKDVIETQLKILQNENRLLAYHWEKKEKELSGGLIVHLN